MVSLEVARKRIEALTVRGQLDMIARLFDYLDPESRAIVVILARALARFHETFKDPLESERR